MIRLKSLMFSLLLLGAALVASQSARAAEPPAQSLEDHLKATRVDIRARRESGIRTLVSLGHHNVYLGSGEIYYSIATGSDESPENFKLKDAIKRNWKIQSISWPGAAW